jgi:hypothetical protein
MAAGMMIAVSRRNGAYVIAAQPEFKLIGQNRFSGDDSDFNATPALDGARIYLRSNRFLYCVAGSGAPLHATR